MKILAPVSSAGEATALIRAGAGELYCGLHPKAWVKRFGEGVWLNRRGSGSANVESLGELKETTEAAHGLNVPVFLTLNLPFYPPEQYPEIMGLVDKATVRCGIDALIIGDPGLIVAVREEFKKVLIHASSLAAILNSYSVLLFRALGASRIIFPRYVDPGDLKIIMDKAGRDIEYEVFILNDGCVFEEGYCHVSHAFGGAFCHRPWSYTLNNTGGGQNTRNRESFGEHIMDYRRWQWFIRNCGGGPDPKGNPLGMCGLCALPDLKELGVTSLKIVGREAPTAKKTASVRLVKQVLDYVKSGEPKELVKIKAKKIRGTYHLCASGYMCYYR